MLLCVAGGSGAEFRRDRPQAGSRCSSQSFLIKSNANQQVMVEERCSMTSSAASNDHVAARATLSLHLKSNKVPVKPHSCSKESSVAYKSRVIVVSGEGAAFSSCSDKGETCSTTTTFKSNVVNGKRGTNTILVRYKPSKPVSVDSDDELQFEFSSKDDDVFPSARSSSPPSSASSESSSVKKDKPSISAWAQIMELEGYRSPAVGLDNGPSKRVPSESDSISNFSSLSAESYKSELSKPSESSYSYERQTGDEGRFRKHNIISIASKCAPSTVNDSAESCTDNSNNRYVQDISLNPDGSNQLQILSIRPKGFVPNRYSDTVSNSVSSNDISGVPQTLSKMPPKCKSSMYRSESSRVSKIPSQEKHKYRRKTLPDGTLSLNATDAPLNKPNSTAKNQKSPEHDPNASWGRYNSRAMRDSVRKVAEKYAETVYMRRQTRSQLDSLPESKRVPMTRCIAHSSDHDHPRISQRELPSQNHLYLSKRANSTSHLHEIPSEKESSSRNRLHFIMPASLRHDHSSMHAINNCHKTVAHYKPKEWKMNQDQEEEANFILSENSRLNSSIDEDSLNSVDASKLFSLDFNYENVQNSSFEKDTNEIFDSDFGNNNLQEDRCRSILSHTKKIQTSNPIKSSQSISSIECRISSAETKPFQVSVRLQDLKSKLCADCAQSTELGPPNKQSACRARHHVSDACSHKDVMISQISLLKRAPLVIDEGDSSPPLYLRPATSKFDNGARKCTMLTAREMEELVHGKESADSKLNQASVTSKVSNWIQKQKDKRKPVFFIGDAPAFYNEKVNESNLVTNSKYPSHKSRRSLSLSSVREGEASRNVSDKPDNTSDLSSFANGDEMLLKPNEHKGLFIKRTSSSCSNRGSIRRKGRQGSPAREEKELIKNCHCHHNQVDGSITSWGNRIHRKPKNCCHKEILTSNDLGDKNNTESLVQSEDDHYHSEISQQKCSIFRKNIEHLTSNSSPKASSEKRFSTSEALNLHVANNNLIYGDSLDPSLLGGQGSRHSYSVISTPNSDLSELARPERSSTAKKLLNFKQITRALSLHSLKKKTKEVPMCSNAAAQLPGISLSKWSRGSKRKIENMKYGSLRKSISYCELTARGAKVSGKLDFPIKSLNITQKPPSKPPSCACASSLRRSVSLYWQFPLHKTQEYAIESPKSDLLAKICFSRLYRRNTVLPFLRDVKNKKPETSEVSKHHHSNGETRNSLLDYKQQSTRRPFILKHQKKPVLIVNELDSPQSALNGDKDLQEESGIIMGLGRNYILNEIDSSSNLSVLEEYLPATSDSKLMNNKVPVSMNKNKTPIVLRLQNKTSRSERYAKGRSASEIWSKNDQKSSSNKKRPSSQFYDIEEFDLKSENEPNLGQISNIVSCSQPSLCAVDQISTIPQSSSGLVNRHLPLHTSTPQLTPADSLLQRFRKSFAVRFKKKTEAASNAGTPTALKPSTDLVSNSKDLVDTPKEKLSCNVQNNCITIDQSQSKPANICDKKTSPSVRRRDLSLTYSTCRKRNKRKTDWRTSLFCDSVDSVFDTANKLGVDKCRMPHFTRSDANTLRKRAASASDYSPKSNDLQRPVVVDCLKAGNSDDLKIPDGKQDLRTPPETANSEDQQKNVTSLDQIWRANPVKLCRVHSRLLMCRHKGRYRLRRSISQPVELEMSGSVHNLRESTHGSADHDSFQKGSLSSEDEASSESDIYHSYCCSPTRRSNTCWELSADGTMYAEALWDHETLDSEELPFQAGDIIEVTDTSDQDWWWGTKDGQGGWFPSAFVRLYVSHRGPSLHFNGQQSDGIQIPYSPCKVSMNNLSCEQVRANIVQEIVATERDYVKHLKDVVEGYLKQVHRRPDMFSKERIETVFGNIKEIYTFQSQFLKELEDCLDKESPHLSQIGNCFLNHKEEFKIYSQYCNNHPLAVSELQELYCDSQYIHFFEACRLLQEMIDISLDGFLLTPIQRICKYPLQLAELLKFTDENHPDHVPVSNALSAMKEVAELVNERKRRMECLERLAEWQSTIEGWEGPDVLDTSSVLIHCGEVTRVSSSWSRDIYLFLFDHQLIYCKKDLLKRHTYAYKGRLNLDHCDIVDVEDGKDSQFAVNVKNAWKIYCKDKEKWYLFYAKTFPEKEQWLRAFKAERQRVNDDEKQAFVVTEEAKRSARLAVHNKHKPKRPRAKFTKGRRCHPDVAVTELLLDSPNAKSRSGSLPSNIHPELAIMAGAKLGPTRKKGSGWFHFGSGKKPKS